MTVVRCPIAGTYLVRDETQPIPVGKSPVDVSTVVYRYQFGWVCGECGGYSGDTTRIGCYHIKAAQEAAK